MRIKNMLRCTRFFCIGFISVFSFLNLNAQKPAFNTLFAVHATSCKNQAHSSTCWSFATTSFIESELFRISKSDVDLSEMFFVRHIYPEKSVNYIRWHGKSFFTPGGQPHDVLNVIKNYGFVPENAYRGIQKGKWLPEHAELDTLMKVITRNIANSENGGVNGPWRNVIETVLDDYLGKLPVTFSSGGKEFTPFSFLQSTGFNPDDYVEITSYMHHPYYSSFVLETKYNWSHDSYYNIPFTEFSELFKHALENGYSIIYNGDVSEDEFSSEFGMAVLPVKKWEEKNELQQQQTFLGREEEFVPTAELRQQMFDSRATTVDHVMHITGLAEDANGKKYYIIKNSWGDPASNGGVIYMSESYLLLKCVSVLINKEALKPALRKKLGIN
ncbi:MAG: C1 family peptidase [Bacteroidota bacterium]